MACTVARLDYFTFEIDGQKVGHLETDDDGQTLYARAVFEVGKVVTDNPFWTRYEGDRIVAYRHGEGEWTDFDGDPDVFPSSAMPLLAGRLSDGETISYRQLNEQTGQIDGEVLLTRRGDQVTEETGGEDRRYMIFRDGQVVEYGWGSAAVSRKVGSLEEALYGTSLD